MFYILYLVVAAIVVWLAIKASNYIDMIDRKTKLSGAFLGGVLLSAITSLPELFTSISATLLIHKPSLCIGNILGSNLFNLLILATMILLFFKSSLNAKLSKSHRIVILYLLLCYLFMGLGLIMPKIFDYHILTIGITSIVIAVCYFLGVRHLAGESSTTDETEKADDSSLSLRTIVVRFILSSVGLVGLSIAMTFLTDRIATDLGLGASLAGALFLGIATSLPELSSTITLFRIKNYDIATGNIVGSCLFNMIILTVADLLWTKGTIYDYSDPKNAVLLGFCTIAALFALPMIRTQKPWIKAVAAVGIIGCYVAFLAI